MNNSHAASDNANNDFFVEILDDTEPEDRARLDALRSTRGIRVHDTLDEQRASLAEVFPRPDEATMQETPRWIHYPWRSSLVRLLGPRSFRRLRLDRNRLKITAAEQTRLADLTVGIVGLSVGHAVAHTLALEGLAGTIRVTDFDTIDLSNLNRVPGSVFDLGVNKAVVAARRIAELDPYLRVETMQDGVDATSVDRFLDGLDVVLEECDSFDAKVIVRDHARARGIPVIMETSDGGVLDVERFDLDRSRPLFHGLLGDIDAGALADLTTAQKVPLGLALLDASRVTSRMAASALELGRTIATWPQLGSDVALGGASCAAAVRRFGLGSPLPSGRVRIDLDSHVVAMTDPLTETGPDPFPAPPGTPEDTAATFASLPDRDAVVFAGSRAPSAGNSQPWVIADEQDAVTVTLNHSRSRTSDLDHRAGAVALGAVAYNMGVAAAARSVAGTLSVSGSGADLAVRYTFGSQGDAGDTATLDAVLRRATDRSVGDGKPLPENALADITAAAEEAGGTVRALTDAESIERCASIVAAHERIRFLTPGLHREMMDDIRWSDSDGDPDTGVSVADMGPISGLLAIARRADVMTHLDDWDAGSALALPTIATVGSSSAVVAICRSGTATVDFVHGGMAAEAAWVRATGLGLAVAPVVPVSLHALDDADRRALSPTRADELAQLDRELRELFVVADDEHVSLILRVFRSDVTPPLTRRRARGEVSTRRRS